MNSEMQPTEENSVLLTEVLNLRFKASLQQNNHFAEELVEELKNG